MKNNRFLILCGMIAVAYSTGICVETAEAQTPLNTLTTNTASIQLKTTLNSIAIPSKVLANSWALTNCAYCENDVADYIRNHSQLPTVWRKYINTAQGKSRNNKATRERLEIKLEDGGIIEIEIWATSDSISIDIVKITDPNGNNVPKHSSQIHSGIKYRSSVEYFPIIKNAFSNFGYKATRDSATGIITIDTKSLLH